MRFYVYEHWRPDTDLPFYVGKGTGRRAYDIKKRGDGHCGIARELASKGMCIEVRMVASGLEEADAFRIEVERICTWREAGVYLVNKASGGFGGSSGYRHTPEAKAKIGAAFAGRVIGSPSQTHRDKIGIANRNPSSETRAKMSASAKKRIASVETRAKISASLTGRPCSSETRAKLRSARAKTTALMSGDDDGY